MFSTVLIKHCIKYLSVEGLQFVAIKFGDIKLLSTADS